MENKIKFAVFIILMVGLCWMNGYAKKIGVIYTFDPIKLDGQFDDWQNIKLYQSNSGKTEYAFKMDNNNLYVLFKFNDPNVLSTFNSNGMKIWINKIDNKKHQLGINFIKKTLTPDQMVALLEKKYGKMPDDKKNQIYNKKKYDIYQSLIIKEEKKKTTTVKLNANEACAFMLTNTKDGKVVIEYKIPHVVQKQLLSIGQLHEEIRFDFEWGGMTKEMYEKRLKMRQAMSVKGNTQERRISSISAEGSANTVGRSQVYSNYARNVGPKKYNINLKLVLPIDKITQE